MTFKHKRINLVLYLFLGQSIAVVILMCWQKSDYLLYKSSIRRYWGDLIWLYLVDGFRFYIHAKKRFLDLVWCCCLTMLTIIELRTVCMFIFTSMMHSFRCIQCFCIQNNGVIPNIGPIGIFYSSTTTTWLSFASVLLCDAKGGPSGSSFFCRKLPISLVFALLLRTNVITIIL